MPEAERTRPAAALAGVLVRWPLRRPPEHRVRRGALSRAIFALIGLRPPAAQHTAAEGELLRSCATGRRSIVEIGVAEGASAWEMRSVMDPGGTIYLVDPYPIVAVHVVVGLVGRIPDGCRESCVRAAGGD